MTRQIAWTIFGLIFTCALASCRKEEAASPSQEGDAPLYSGRTTGGDIAVGNLDAQLRGITRSAELHPEVMGFRVRRVALLQSHADFLGSYDRLDEILKIADEVVELRPEDPDAYLLRARTRAAVHRFDDALADISRAEELGAQPAQVEGQRTTIWIAQGTHLKKVLGIRKQQAERSPGYTSWSSLAVAHAALGQFDEADAAYQKALDSYQDTNPFPVAWVFFQRGAMWAEKAGQPEKAKPFYEEAARRLPAYVRNTVHLAELEVAAGERDEALERLRLVVEKTYDPEPIGYLGQLLVKNAATRTEGRAYIEEAANRYESLLERYPKAFADHGAEFYMGAGHDPARAYELARVNLGMRKTDRAYRLAIKAADAAGESAAACDLADEALGRTIHNPQLADLAGSVSKRCKADG